MAGTRSTTLGVVAITLAAGLALLAPLDPSAVSGAPPGGPRIDSPTVEPGTQAGTAPTSPPVAGGYGWPLTPEPAVLTPFSEPEQVWSPGHRGVDLAGTPGQDVLAAADGVVAFAGRVVDRPVLSVDHPDGIRTTYEPVSTTLPVGTVVRRGDVIGQLARGDAGPHCGPAQWCLHWGARLGRQRYLDPLTLLVADPVIRLYPVDDAGAPSGRAPAPDAIAWLTGRRAPPRTRTADSGCPRSCGGRPGPPAPPRRPPLGRSRRGPWPSRRWPGGRR
ncbi:M23 family metallopeptidase [Ruania sp. N2-46]|uniref:M23 family metallopeptidase n=1 Tax=Occultella gossypii TaxID=2800820 RepID=A0ABS7S6H9_9MICO|nr:M23 family metallopeptidase [Occultella gossypii]